MSFSQSGSSKQSHYVDCVLVTSKQTNHGWMVVNFLEYMVGEYYWQITSDWDQLSYLYSGSRSENWFPSSSEDSDYIIAAFTWRENH